MPPQSLFFTLKIGNNSRAALLTITFSSSEGYIPHLAIIKSPRCLISFRRDAGCKLPHAEYSAKMHSPLVEIK